MNCRTGSSEKNTEEYTADDKVNCRTGSSENDPARRLVAISVNCRKGRSENRAQSDQLLSNPVYFEQEPAPEREHLVNLEDLYAKRGREGLYQFLLDARPANHKPSYRETFAMAYPEYVKDFLINKQAVEALMKKWQAAGHYKSDL